MKLKKKKKKKNNGRVRNQRMGESRLVPYVKFAILIQDIA